MGRGQTIIVHIPLTFRKRGGRKLVVTPDGADWAPRPGIDNAMVKALARAFRWREMLESSKCTTVKDIADTEKINESYVGRVLRLTLLAPDIVEAVLGGRHPEQKTLAVLMRRFPTFWPAQRSALL